MISIFSEVEKYTYKDKILLISKISSAGILLNQKIFYKSDNNLEENLICYDGYCDGMVFLTLKKSFIASLERHKFKKMNII